mmetsp:Transcript_2450/g.9232  ORF Transcript_2450/g.9232 Transcript_2450/m.9232 type:complete len:83 (+) Transcript_2450:2183-2431(+)
MGLGTRMDFHGPLMGYDTSPAIKAILARLAQMIISLLKGVVNNDDHVSQAHEKWIVPPIFGAIQGYLIQQFIVSMWSFLSVV